MDRGRPSDGEVSRTNSGTSSTMDHWSLLQEALVLEPKFQPCLVLSDSDYITEDVTVGLRDGSAHVLRCLKVWYDLPPEVFFVAVNLMDRFLTKMKVRPRHMACISASSLMLASRLVPASVPPNGLDMITISQCKCSLGDLDRMQTIIMNKLETEPGTVPVTPFTFVQLISLIVNGVPPSSDLVHHLEIIACDATCVNYRPAEIALALFDSTVYEKLYSVLSVSAEGFSRCLRAVRSILDRYHAHAQVQHRQQLIWRLSNRTMRQLRPTGRLTRTLPTIRENYAGMQAHDDGVWADDQPPQTFHCDD